MSPVTGYLVIRCSKCNFPYGETYYYASSDKKAQEYVATETAKARAEGRRYYWKIHTIEIYKRNYPHD